MRWLLVGAIRHYQKHWTRFTPRCPQNPSCSEFGIAAIQEFGVSRGIMLTAIRLSECTGEEDTDVHRHQEDHGLRTGSSRNHDLHGVQFL